MTIYMLSSWVHHLSGEFIYRHIYIYIERDRKTDREKDEFYIYITLVFYKTPIEGEESFLMTQLEVLNVL